MTYASWIKKFEEMDRNELVALIGALRVLKSDKEFNEAFSGFGTFTILELAENELKQR